MKRARVPKDARIFFEVGTDHPSEVDYDPFEPFKILWVVTNGKVRRNFLWVTIRKTGIYVAFGGSGNMHTSYHTDGTLHWKSKDHAEKFEQRPPLPNIPGPVLIQSGTTVIANEAFNAFKLTTFEDKPVDRVIYLDNRMLPEAVYYHVWAVPPFMHGEVPLLTKHPAHIHVITHTNPWIEVVIYEQGKRKRNNG